VNPDIQLVAISKVTACPTRVFLLGVLGPTGCTVTDAAAMAGVTVSTASYHLRRLVGVGLARMARRGRTHIYKWSKDRWYFMCQQADDDGQPGVVTVEAAPAGRSRR
jgi:DNA-binding transcriptional ArsR family regulator